jgi:RNA-directed DNA polymerase
LFPYLPKGFVSKVLKGALNDLDLSISGKLDAFRAWFARQIKDQDWRTKRRMGGVGLLSDIQPKSLDDVPFTLGVGSRFNRTTSIVTISTDGSIATIGRRKGKDQGPGGWAFVVHGTDESGCGRIASATNNQMELRAVIEAMRSVDPKRPVIIRTDSQYVSDAINRQTTIKTNGDLWKEYSKLAETRRVRVVWVKGHAGDPHNERADRLANEQANIAKAEFANSISVTAN